MGLFLNFPDGDPRSKGGVICKRRPWIRQGAACRLVTPARSFFTRYAETVHFGGAPKGEYDLVSPEFLSHRGVVPREAHEV